MASSATPNDNRMISTIKKNNFPTFIKVMNLLGKIDVSLSRECKPLVTLKNKKAQKNLQSSRSFILWGE